jgi:hypothetical protein
MGKSKGLCRVLVRKPKEESQFGRPRRRWENNINMDIQKVECEDMDGLISLKIETGSGHL